MFDFSLKDWQGSFPNEGECRFRFTGSVDKLDGSSSKKTISRNFTVHSKTAPDNEYFRIISIIIHKYDIEYNSGSSSVTELLCQVASLYDHCVLKTNHVGTIVNVMNYYEIREKWNKIKENIEKVYKGSNIRKFIRSIDSRLRSESNIISYISSFENFGLVFNSIYGKYDGLASIKRKTEFTGWNNVYTVEESVKLSDKDDNVVTLSLQNGTEYHKNLKYAGTYQINVLDNWIEKASIKATEIYEDFEVESKFNLEQEV